MAVSPIGDSGTDYSTGPWSKQSDDIVNQDIQAALKRNNGDVAAAAEDLRLRRNDPQNFSDTNMAMAEDYLYARADAGNKWLGGRGSGNVGTIGETAKIDTYMALKQITPLELTLAVGALDISVGLPPSVGNGPWSPDAPAVAPQGAGPVSPYSDKEKEWMLKGVDDAKKLDGAGSLPAARLMNEPPYYAD